MYSSCLYCSSALGSNEVFAALPVGRRIAFDPARGRLWVVCQWCHRWNLTPLDDRLETLDECERRFRNTRLRFSTANIGLAYLKEGVTLVRIGPAMKPEIAAWRYGRYLEQWAPAPLVGPLRTASRQITAVIDRSMTAVADKVGVRRKHDLATWMRLHYRPDRVVAQVGADAALRIRARHLDSCLLIRPDPKDPWQLEVAHDGGTIRLSGPVGLSVAAKLLASLNGAGATDDVVRYAVTKLEDAANPAGYFARVAMIAMRSWWGRKPDAPSESVALAEPTSDAERLALHITKRSFWGRGGLGSEPRTSLPRLPLVDRLALEMAANEDAEREAMEGELAALENAWREAEEIAAIADNLPLEASELSRAPSFGQPRPSCA